MCDMVATDGRGYAATPNDAQRNESLKAELEDLPLAWSPYVPPYPQPEPVALSLTGPPFCRWWPHLLWTRMK